jgi:HTH-type transcriptional regulator/antitoxin HigA
MNITHVETETEYQNALKRLEEIFDASSNSKDGDELKTLVILIDNFEKKHFPIELPDPIEAIK